MAKKYSNCRERQIRGHTYWVARLVFPPDPTSGVRPKAKEFSAKTATEAHNAREEYRKKYTRNPKADRNMTLGQFIETEFIPHEEARYKSGGISWGRYQERKSRLTRFVLTHAKGKQICGATLADLTPELLEAYFEELLKANLTANRRNMVRQDLWLTLCWARRRLALPVTEYFIDIKSSGSETKPKKLFNDEDILDRIEDESLPLESRAIIAFEFMINCRPNEMWPLMWSDIDWRAGEITIDKAVQRDAHGFIVKQSTKTGRKGDRSRLPLGSQVADLLRRLHKMRMANGPSSEYIFCRPDGGRHETDSFRYAWRRIRQELNLPEGPTFYSLKTSGNSYALAHGVSSAAQARKMGHASTRMADNAYRTLMGAELVNAVEVYGNRSKRSV